MPRITITSPEGKGGILVLTKPVTTIGRGNANDLVLNDTSVSRFHAVLKLGDDGNVVIADRGSTNGVLVNEERITAETPLADGAVARIGIYRLKFEREDDGALVVHKAEMPSALNQIIHGGPLEPLPSAPETPTGTAAELVQQVRRLERENYLLTVLYDAGKALTGKLSADDVAEQVMQLAFRIEGVERGFMMLFDEQGRVTRQSDVRYRRQPPTHQPQIILSRSILERLQADPAPILIADASQDERFAASESLKISGLRSAMCAPLMSAAGKLLGVLYVDNLERAAAFTQEELNVFALVAAQAAAALDNARAHQQLAEQAVHRSALERFLSPEVVEMVAANPQDVRLGGVNQKASILFADIRGFTALSERLAPELVVEILNEYFTRVTDVVFDHGGTLDKYLGDGVMAVFGAPFSKGNDAANAARAAMAIQALVLELNRDSRARQWPELRVGVGINTGAVVAGNIGSPRRLDYTVVGDTVNVAARLMAHAVGGQILISQATAQDLDSAFNLAPLTPILVKGKSEPVPVFAVRWMESAGAVS
ncbi:MAG TPA: adenylate/guanylate cyclase domain-containing protein [Terriglobales bacterium]|nr:adenylate/guanylate cyclase domain-containing protein [Terriglobales bacterium]